MIKSYWLRILLCGIGAAVLGFIIALLTPKQYDAVVQLMVAPYSPYVSRATNEADESVEDILSVSAPRTVNTQVEVLTSFGVLGTAAQTVASRHPNMDIREGSELYPFDLQDRVRIIAARESDIVTMYVRLSDPELAREVAEAIYLAFEEENDRQAKGGATRAISFLNSQTDVVKRQLELLDSEASKIKVTLNAPDIQAQTTSEIATLRDLETQLALARADVSAAEARAAGIQAQMGAIPQTVVASSLEQLEPKREQLQQAIIAAQADRAQALERYLEDSEQVRSIDRRIARLGQDLKKYNAPFVKGQVQTAPNPLLQQLRAELATTTATASAARQRAATLEGSYTRKLADVARLPEVQRKLNSLGRRQQILERINALYTNRLSTLELAQSGRRTSTALVTPAQAISRPMVPNYSLNVGLGLFLGLAAGFLWSVGIEAKRNPVRSLGQLNRLALQPCYRVIPELRVPMRGLNRAPAEVFDALLANFIRSEKKGYRMGVLGVSKGAGATNAAMNVAIAAARSGYSVLYVEVDPGNNALTKLTPAAGDVKSAGANITIYNASLNESVVFGAAGLPQELEVAAQGKDLIIFDFAPVKVSGDAFILANHLDEMVLLVRANVTKSVDFLQAQQALIDAGCPLVTVSLTRLKEQSDDVAALEQQADIRAIAPQA